jgi:hypothetical protein
MSKRQPHSHFTIKRVRRKTAGDVVNIWRGVSRYFSNKNFRAFLIFQLRPALLFKVIFTVDIHLA